MGRYSTARLTMLMYGQAEYDVGPVQCPGVQRLPAMLIQFFCRHLANAERQHYVVVRAIYSCESKFGMRRRKCNRVHLPSLASISKKLLLDNHDA